MIRKLHVLLLLLVLPLTGLAQLGNEDLRTMLIVRDLERESRPSRGTSGGPEVVGDPYFTKSWSPGVITLYRENKTYNLTALKYDVYNFGIDVMIDQKFRSLDGSLIKSFEYSDSLTKIPHSFLNGKDFTRDGAAIRGFLEVLSSGKVDVYSLIETTLLRPNYNTAIGSGSENYIISKRRYLLYGTANELRPVNKKELTKIWAEREADMKKFQKVNKLNLNEERDLLLMVDYYNTL